VIYSEVGSEILAKINMLQLFEKMRAVYGEDADHAGWVELADRARVELGDAIVAAQTAAYEAGMDDGTAIARDKFEDELDDRYADGYSNGKVEAFDLIREAVERAIDL
jgi:hypothetical protein